MKHLSLIIILVFLANEAICQLPSGFSKTTLLSENSTVIGMVFDQNDKIYYWDKSGKVWTMHNNTKIPTPVVDISSQVRDFWDLGLIGFALDPDYLNNGHIYLSFAMDETMFPGYNLNEPASQMRVARFTVNNPNSTSPSAPISSQINLLGANPGEGPPILFHGHMGGAIAFGDDGSLMITSGDGAIFDNDDNGSKTGTFYQQALTLGIITPSENIGSNRCQMDESLSGKLLRIDPTTGYGLAGNPMFDINNPNSKQSKIYAKGLRNPWKITHIPNTGNHHNPGQFIIGEVGSIYHDELIIVDQAGLNYGWPHFEGFDKSISGRLPQYQPTTWEKPKIDMRSQIRGKVGNSFYPVNTSQFPGDDINHNYCIVSGIQYTKTQFPTKYHNTLFFGDHSTNKIYYTRLKSNNDPEFSKLFGITNDRIYHLAVPNNEDAIYYIGGNANGTYTTINKISYSSGNLKPIAVIDADTTSGDNSLTVRFTADLSYDPDPSDQLTFEWTFSDGQSATGLSPSLRFQATGSSYESIKAELKVTDNHGSYSEDELYISLNNKAPVINSIEINPIIGKLTPLLATPVTLTALVNDDHSPVNSLIYKWDIYEVHNGHVHIQNSYTGNGVNVSLPATFCNPPNASYWVRVVLTVTDQQGISTKKTYHLEPDCGLLSQSVSFNPIPTKLTTDNPFSLGAVATSGLPISYYKVSGPIGISGNQCSVLGQPGIATIRATQHGSAIYNPAFLQEQTFRIVAPRTPQSVNITNPVGLLENNQSYTLNAMSSLARPVKFVIVNGNASISGNTLTIGSGSPFVTVRAFNEGDDNVEDGHMETTFEICSLHAVLTGTVSNSETDTFKAKNTITSSQQIIATNSAITLSAKDHILMNPGFNVNAGSIFQTDLVGCGNN